MRTRRKHAYLGVRNNRVSLCTNCPCAVRKFNKITGTIGRKYKLYPRTNKRHLQRGINSTWRWEAGLYYFAWSTIKLQELNDAHRTRFRGRIFPE